MATVFWFRRDLRLQDNVALNRAITAAIEDGSRKLAPTYLVDLDKFDGLSGSATFAGRIA